MYGSTPGMTDATIRMEQAAETPSGQSQLAYKLAGAFTIAGGVLTLMAGVGTAVVGVVIDIVLGIGLIQLRGWARVWMIIRAIGAAILVPFLASLQGDAVAGAVVIVVGWMYVAALLLLLTGRSAMWRVATSAVLFGLYALVSLFGLLVMMTQ
jgi:hypothetical protein